MASAKLKAAVAAGVVVAAAVAGYAVLDRSGKLEELLRRKSAPAPVAGERPAAEVDAGDLAPPASFAELSPEISLIGEDGVVPEAVRIQFGRAVTTDPNAAVPSETIVSIEPPIEGSLSHDGDRALRFVPETPFAFETAYTVRVERVSVNGSVVAAPAKDAAARAFTTPKFGIVRANLSGIDAASARAAVTVVFTGAVDSKKLASHAVWRGASGGVSAEWRAGLKANEAVADLPQGAFDQGSGVKLTVKADMPSAVYGAVLGKAASFDVRMAEGKEVEIKQVKLKEGANGFYVQVTCNDLVRRGDQPDGHGRQIYFWDDDMDQGLYLSDRCQLDESSTRGRLRFVPDVKWTMVPSRGGFRILGDFRGGELEMIMDGGIQSIDGAVLKVPLHQTFTVPPRKPSVGFAAQGRYLPRASWKSLGLRHLNVGKALVEGRVIPPQNLAFWLGSDSERADERLADLVVQKEIALQGTTDVMTTTWIDLQSMLPEVPKGVIELTVVDLPARKAVERKRLIVTDINLIAKRGSGGKTTQVWALDSHGNKPIPGVRLKLIVKSGRAVAECETGGDGGCLLSYDRSKALDPAEPLAIVAQKADDLTYIRFADLKAEVSETIVQGRPFSGGETPYRAALWSDRGAYRPGETAHVAAVVRGQNELAPEAGLPVELRLFDPREKLTRKQALTLNAAGYAAADLKFESYANTGRYRVAVFAGGREIGRYSFNVEELVPERMKVDVLAAQENLLAQDSADIEVISRYLFGGSAEGSRVELRCEILPGEFKPKENANFSYGVWYPDLKDQPRPLTLGSVNGTLDEAGRVKLACPTPAQGGGFAGAAKLRARGIVFEGESGRSSQNDVEVPVHPEKFYVGLSSGQQKLKRGETLTYEGVVVDWSGKLTDPAVEGGSAEVEIELVRLETEWDFSYDDGEGDASYRRYIRQASEGRTRVAVSGGRFKGELKVPGDAAGYLIRARLGHARTDLSFKGEEGDYWWYPTESSRDQTPKPFKPQWIDLADAAPVKVGDELVVKFDAPYKGRVLLTAETDEIIASEWREVMAGPVEWTLPVKTFHANVYVSAFAIKDPHLESQQSFMPDRAFGVRSYRIAPVAFQHELSVKVPAEMRPNNVLTVELEVKGDVEDEAYATVAAVDEGILALTRFKTPDPIKALFEPRALGVETFETIGWNVMLTGAGTASSTGGDGLADDVPVQLVKPVALWSGLVKLEDGKAKVSFEVPQYRGELRVMAVSFDKRRTGAASAQVQVRDPLVLQATLPRFLTEGDDVTIPVSVTNMSGKSQKIKVQLSTTGVAAGDTPAGDVVRIEGKTEQLVPLEPGKSETVLFRAVATAVVGAASFSVKAEADGIVSHEDLEVPIFSAAPRTRMMKRLVVADGDVDLLPEAAGWIKGTERTSVWVTANPYADTLAHLEHLVHYPYGCIEQTTSTTRPLLVLRELLQDVDPTLLPAGSNIDDMVSKGIERILSMQTPSGGFGYWPGDDTPTPWGTAYATHLLLDALALNFSVPKERVDEAVQWLDQQVVNTFRNLPENEAGNDRYQDLRHSVAYMHYVLARAGKSYKADIEKLIERTAKHAGEDDERKEQLYTLKAALWLAGDRRYEGDLKSLDVRPLTGQRKNSWSFYSDLRYRGMMLSTFTDLFKDDPAGEKLADLVAQGLRQKQSSWYTTQELVWAITGLGKRVGHGAVDFEAALTVDGKKRDAQRTAKGMSWLVPRASEKSQLSLHVERPGEGKLYAVLASEGVKDPPDLKTGGSGLEVTRAWHKADGSALDPAADVKLGEIIFTELTIKNSTSETIENVALVDRLPAAFEIENPRLGRGAEASFIDKELLWELSYMNIRDDRLEVFGALRPQAIKKVWYAARAVVSGRFTIPPVEAEAMYDPDKWARESGGKTNVKGPWEEFAAQ
jgi:uncharacterized protein YfaS (alpha-2-macroglobulin family)